MFETTKRPDKTGEKQGDESKQTQFRKGRSGNPKGRPKGSFSIRDKIRQYLEAHPKEVQKIVEHFVKNNRELMWQMLEGKPNTSWDLAVDTEGIAELTQFFRNMANPAKDDRDKMNEQNQKT